MITRRSFFTAAAGCAAACVGAFVAAKPLLLVKGSSCGGSVATALEIADAMKFHDLVACGRDIDGTIKPLADLSYFDEDVAQPGWYKRTERIKSGPFKGTLTTWDAMPKHRGIT